MLRLTRRSSTFAASVVAALAFAVASGAALAQTAAPFGGFQHDSSQPIQVSSDTLQVRNTDQVAIFEGQVDVVQGRVRMNAERLEVTYRNRSGEGDATTTTAAAAPGSGAIDRLRAIGNVLISSGEETAKADSADYDVAAGEIVLSGNVLLLQGQNIVRGTRLRIDLATGTAKMDSGRVQMSLEPASDN